MPVEPEKPGIQTIICNEDLWYFRLGAKLGLYRKDLTHSTIHSTILAVPRKEVEYWRDRLVEHKAGELEDGAVKGLFVHESVHSRQMDRRNFWLWALRYLLFKSFRRRMEEEAYTKHLIYLAQCNVPIEAPYWIEHLQDLYFGAFDEKRATEAFERMCEKVRAGVPEAPIHDHILDPEGTPASLPWLETI
ncbi:MAG: hypothetical protein ACYTFG_15365 [Planctomycetota bacterium]|jgi:hypothetical protein